MMHIDGHLLSEFGPILFWRAVSSPGWTPPGLGFPGGALVGSTDWTGCCLCRNKDIKLSPLNAAAHR